MLWLVYVPTFARPPPLSMSLLWGRTLTGSPSVNRSATFEHGTMPISGYAPMGRVSAHGVTMLSVDISVKLFVCCLTFVF